jgi:cell division protein FtsN
MNRDDLLKRCVDRRVAHETSVVAVSHLFYVYLLSALKKGQQVEVPNFGTFGARIVGVKRQRRMPYFDVENELAEKVNERYRSLKTRLVGKYELTPVEGEVEYEGKEPPYDPLAAKMGKEVVLDTYRDITPEQFAEQQPYKPARTVPEIRQVERTFEQQPPRVVEPPRREEVISEQEPALSKERKLMPKLNLRGEGMGEVPPERVEPETQPSTPEEAPPTTRDYSYSESKFSSPLWQILIGVLLLAAVTFVLNQIGWIRFWGTRTPTQTEETLPPVVQPPPQVSEETQQTPTPVPSPEEKKPITEEAKPPVVTETKPPVKEPPKIVETKQPPSGVPVGIGEYTLQVSSWDKRIDAVRMVSRLSKVGVDAYIAEGFVKGRKWFRVRVGRYATAAEAQAASSRVQSLSGNGVWVTKVN